MALSLLSLHIGVVVASRKIAQAVQAKEIEEAIGRVVVGDARVLRGPFDPQQSPANELDFILKFT